MHYQTGFRMRAWLLDPVTEQLTGGVQYARLRERLHFTPQGERTPRLTASRYRQPKGYCSAPVYRATELARHAPPRFAVGDPSKELCASPSHDNKDSFREPSTTQRRHQSTVIVDAGRRDNSRRLRWWRRDGGCDSFRSLEGEYSTQPEQWRPVHH